MSINIISHFKLSNW